MEFRLKKEIYTSWRCQVKIRWEYDDKEHTKRNKAHEEVFGSEIADPSQVEERVRSAQKAVLNPSTAPSSFLEERLYGDNTNELRFSQNVVCIEISGKNLPNLSLIDLPGIIRHTEDHDVNLVKHIIDMVNHYISRRNSIIIATITCKDDIENQEILQMAYKHDRKEIRTLGVLTKPDTIEPGCHDRYLKVITGKLHELKLGYYVVRNLTQAELLEGNKNARKIEAEFFKGDVWQGVRPEQLGVPNLIKRLSSLLINAVKEQLPSIREEVWEKLREVHSLFSFFN